MCRMVIKRKRGIRQVVLSKSHFWKPKVVPKGAPLTTRVSHMGCPLAEGVVSRYNPCLASWVGLSLPDLKSSPNSLGTAVSAIYHFRQKDLVDDRAGVANFRPLGAECAAPLRSSAWNTYQVGTLVPHSTWTRLEGNTCVNIDVIAAVIGNTSYTLPYISTKDGEQGTYIIP